VEPVPLPGLPSKPKRIDQLLPDEQALIVDAGTAQSLECVNGGAMVTLEGNVLGVDAARTVAYRWTEGEALIAEALTATVFLPLGTHQLTLAVIEDGGRVGLATVEVNVVDTRAPEVSLVLLLQRLWPPNHTMQLVASGIGATDACDGAIGVGVTVSSNQPINGRGDGNTQPDWLIVQAADGTWEVWLRAERAGPLTDRVYTLTAAAGDGSGNRAAVTHQVIVPHDP